MATPNWSMGAVSVRPLQADLSVSVAGTSALYPGNLSYTITVKNNGTSAAAGVTLTDTLAAWIDLGFHDAFSRELCWHNLNQLLSGRASSWSQRYCHRGRHPRCKWWISE